MVLALSGRQKFRSEVRLCSLDVGSMGGRRVEVVEVRWRRRLEVLCVQEIRWKGDRVRRLVGGYKLLHAGEYGRSDDVGIIVSGEISKQVVEWKDWRDG